MTTSPRYALYTPGQVSELLGLSTSSLNQYRKFDIGIRHTEQTRGGHYRYQKRAVMELAFAQALSEFGLKLEAIGDFLTWKAGDLLEEAAHPSEWVHDDKSDPGVGPAFLVVRGGEISPALRDEYFAQNERAGYQVNETLFKSAYRVFEVSNFTKITTITSTGGILMFPKMILRKIPARIYDLPMFEQD
ncbi:MerR family transcriptional regulator [Leisingera sp. HS039]|uniref:helix-turn-helix domain-containing protein n=1 Tax=Leisingera sp. HS039 TaxID=2818496 RepID=UPI001B3A77E9|nr:MerR family transcriptional regulator [Leisingera sp. HS039]MBQ4824150.1 MerR family transcriptional regulator [Leisingera sp. HS039]